MEDWEDFAVDSVVRGHHINKSIWTPFLGEILRAEMEEGNEEDRFAVAILKDGGVVVGHVPRSFSRTFYFFLRHGGSIECKITGHRKFGIGLEVPCTYTLSQVCQKTSKASDESKQAGSELMARASY